MAVGCHSGSGGSSAYFTGVAAFAPVDTPTSCPEPWRSSHRGAEMIAALKEARTGDPVEGIPLGQSW